MIMLFINPAIFMLHDAQCHSKGYILMFTLIMLLVLTALVSVGMQSAILSQKMENNWQFSSSVFMRAEMGLKQLLFSLQGKSFDLPVSSITLQTSYRVIASDACGNQTVDLIVTASNIFSSVRLQSEAVIAKFPALPNCPILPGYQILWWKTV